MAGGALVLVRQASRASASLDTSPSISTNVRPVAVAGAAAAAGDNKRMKNVSRLGPIKSLTVRTAHVHR